MTESPLQQAKLEEIVQLCSEEARHSRTREVGYCFELFRRALEERAEQAWAAIEAQYSRLILKWIYDSPAGAGLDAAEADALKFQALGKFWRTLTRRPLHLAARFQHVGAVLRYLNQCTVTTLLDLRRREQRRHRLQSRLEAEQATRLLAPESTPSVVDRMELEERLQTVRDWIRVHVTDPRELLVLRLSFELDLSPAEIADRHPDDFPDVRDVRRVKERVLKRARRSLG